MAQRVVPVTGLGQRVRVRGCEGGWDGGTKGVQAVEALGQALAKRSLTILAAQPHPGDDSNPPLPPPDPPTDGPRAQPLRVMAP
jgi:hypothetical protein